MARKLRRQPLHRPLHVIARGVKGHPIFEHAESKQRLLAVLEEVSNRFEWTVLNWVIMTNHFHLILELCEPTLSDGMKHLAGVHAQWWNWMNCERGHVYMGRYRSIEIDNSSYLRNVTRYIDLNPVRAGLCAHPSDYMWSGYAGNAGLRAPESFHHAGRGRRSIADLDDVDTSRLRYRRFVCAKIPRWARRGHEFEERLPLIDIIRPGDVSSWAEATGLWWYTAVDIAQVYGVSDTAVRNWIRNGVPPKRLPQGLWLP
jgi:REP element-mobilizing transposase RayT